MHGVHINWWRNMSAGHIGRASGRAHSERGSGQLEARLDRHGGLHTVSSEEGQLTRGAVIDSGPSPTT